MWKSIGSIYAVVKHQNLSSVIVLRTEMPWPVARRARPYRCMRNHEFPISRVCMNSASVNCSALEASKCSLCRFNTSISLSCFLKATTSSARCLSKRRFWVQRSAHRIIPVGMRADSTHQRVITGTIQTSIIPPRQGRGCTRFWQHPCPRAPGP